MIENNTEPQVEVTVGEILRNARTTGRRKREIQTISKLLCIREEFLQALENGNYDALPEPVYILGFARNYAMELGLNPDEIVAKLKREMGLGDECQAHSDKDDAVDDSATCNVAHACPTFGGVLRRAMQFVRAHWVWFAGAVATIVLVIVVVAAVMGGKSNDDATMVADAPVVAAVIEPSYAVAVRERFGVDNRDKAAVILQAIDESWVKVEDGRGNTVFSRVLVPGDVYYVPSGTSTKATFGNAGGVDIWVNGKLAPKAGADHTRKSGIDLSPEKLMPATTASAE